MNRTPEFFTPYVLFGFTCREFTIVNTVILNESEGSFAPLKMTIKILSILTIVWPNQISTGFLMYCPTQITLAEFGQGL